MFFFSTDLSPDGILERITPEVSNDWLALGQAIVSLEMHSRGNDQGMPWIEVVRTHLTNLGGTKTSGHLRKLRRAAIFLNTNAPGLGRSVEKIDSSRVFLTSIETAERLFGLDPEAGREALAASLDGGVPGEINLRYETVRAARPEQLSARQAAWETRKKTIAHGSDPDREADLKTNMQKDLETWWGGSAFGTRVEVLALTKLGLLFAGTTMGILALRPNGQRLIGGLRILHPETVKPEARRQAVEGIALQASFYDRYWIASHMPRKDTDAFWQLLQDLDLGNVGMIHFPDVTGPAERIGLPSGAPSSDRRGMLLNAILQKK